MEEQHELIELNTRFIDACRHGDWPALRPILSGSFVELHGMTGRITDIDTYAAALTDHPAPALVIDDIHVHVDGNTAVVSARTHWGEPGLYGRYADTYERRDGAWVCTHATIWRLPPELPVEPATQSEPVS